ncbi:MAG: helix-turn-helix domain-containing protein [Rhodospirillaceae bacterium]|nr:helix-turn-helix domain-containing protein [Rhodospirillaceae bacterium]
MPRARVSKTSSTIHRASRSIRIVLAPAAGWRARFLAEGVDGLLRDATRPPGKKPIPEEQVKALIALAMSPPPAHVRVRALAGKLGMVYSTVHAILKAHGLRPHQVKTFKVSRDPRVALEVRDVVGLYVDPPGPAQATFPFPPIILDKPRC